MLLVRYFNDNKSNTTYDSNTDHYKYSSHIFQAQSIRSFLKLLALLHVTPKDPMIVEAFHKAT